MSSGSICIVDDRTVVRVSGTDARAFLNGLITNDVTSLEHQQSVFAGLLSPQGKVLFEFIVVADDETLLLDVETSVAAALAQRLSIYKLRSKVTIEAPARQMVCAGVGDASEWWAPGEAVVYRDPRLVALGWRAIPSVMNWRVGGLGDAHRISLGVPEGGKDYLFGELFPHEAMFDQLHGVSFTKGCYVGQEIVARMQHRGTARSRFLMLAAAGPLPERGTEVLAGDKPIGAMGSSVGPNGLALIRLDRLGDAYNERKPITTGAVAITLTKPPYATFEVPTP
jgi:tRNA-modifying protein YgfZ